jgi:hypothetical protein
VTTRRFLCVVFAFSAVMLPMRGATQGWPRTMTSFGGLKVDDAISAAGWKVHAISALGREVSVNVSLSDQPLVIVFSLEKGRPGAFDRDDVRIYYRTSTLPPETINEVGKSTAERVAAFATARGGLKNYLMSTLAQGTNGTDESVNVETARRFLKPLEGKWTMKVATFTQGSTAATTTATGTAQRQRFLNDLIVREDAEGAGGRQFLTVGCSPDAGRCWLFLLDNTSSGYTGGYAVFSGSRNSLQLLNPSGETIVVLHVVDQDHNTLEFYEPGAPPRLARAMSYTRIK